MTDFQTSGLYISKRYFNVVSSELIIESKIAFSDEYDVKRKLRKRHTKRAQERKWSPAAHRT
jgi:hypothetical protein